MPAFYETKNWWQSKTIWTSIVGVIISACALFGIVPETANTDMIVEGVLGAVSVLAIIFRTVATKAVATPAA